MPSRPRLRVRVAHRALCLVGLALCAQASVAAPNAAVDPLAELVASKGWTVVEAAPAAPVEASALQRVRARAADMVLTALAFVGVPYQAGGASESAGFDCSGFTRHVFGNSLGMELPRRADEQARAPGLVEVAADALQPGDLVFFNTMRRTFSHVGIYIGDRRFVHAPRAGSEIRTENMDLAYWRQRFTGARRAEVVEQAAWAPQPSDARPAESR